MLLTLTSTLQSRFFLTSGNRRLRRMQAYMLPIPDAAANGKRL